MEDEWAEKAQKWDKDEGRHELNLAQIAAMEANGIEFAKTMRILDFGGGTGSIGMHLAPRVEKLVIIDGSEGMIDQLKRKIAESGATNVVPIWQHVSSAEDMPDGEFDLIMASNVIHHIPNAEQMVSIFASKVRKGGHVAIFEMVNFKKEHAHHHGHGAGHGHRAGPHGDHHWYTPETLLELLKSTGYEAKVIADAISEPKIMEKMGSPDLALGIITI